MDHTHGRTVRQSQVLAHSDDADARIVYRTLHEDTRAFESIVTSYTPIFYSLLKRMSFDTAVESIEDDLQEIFLRIYKALPTFKGNSPFFSWAYTIAINWIRSRRRTLTSQKAALHVPYDEENKTYQGFAKIDAPEDMLIAAEAEQLLMQALQTLKPVYREVFVLRMMQEVSVTDTAHILKLPEGTVKTYLHRGRQQLRAWLVRHQWDNNS